MKKKKKENENQKNEKFKKLKKLQNTKEKKKENQKKMKKCTARDDTSSSSAAALRDEGTPHSYPRSRVTVCFAVQKISVWDLFGRIVEQCIFHTGMVKRSSAKQNGCSGCLLHLHLQLVSLHACSDLRLTALCLHRADFFKFRTRAQQRREVVT